MRGIKSMQVASLRPRELHGPQDARRQTADETIDLRSENRVHLQDIFVLTVDYKFGLTHVMYGDTLTRMWTMPLTHWNSLNVTSCCPTSNFLNRVSL